MLEAKPVVVVSFGRDLGPARAFIGLVAGEDTCEGLTLYQVSVVDIIVTFQPRFNYIERNKALY